jgi:putative FmdB family regulatory protein
MPVYDYRCSLCHLEVEVRHGIHDHGPTVCSACGGAMRKAMSTPAIHYKGSGWAKKDARAASSSKPASGSTATADKTPTSPASEATVAPSSDRGGGGDKGTVPEAGASTSKKAAPGGTAG